MIGQNSVVKPNPSRLPWDCVVCIEGGWKISLWADWSALRENFCQFHLNQHLNPLGEIKVLSPEEITAALEKGRKDAKAFRESNRPWRGKRY